MSGFSIRRFVMENIAAVALHAPVSSTARAARALRSGADGVRSSWFGRLLVGSEGTSSLLSAEEMDWIRKRRQEAAEESRVVLATRPVPSIIRGVAGALLNSGVGCLVSPIVFLSVTMERLRSASGPRAVAQAPLYGLMWASLFLCTALYAAAQQVCLCSAYSLLLRPWYYASSTSPAVKDVEGPCTTRARILFPVSARFEAPQGVAGSNHPLLAYADTNEVMRERAMKRSHQRRRNKNKGSSTSTGKGYERKTNEDGEDYYELLGLEKTASPKEIKSAYTRLAMKIHPDHNPEPGAADKFDAVTRAYRVLSNADKRRKYDAGGAKGVEDLGAKKREGVRGLFGGATLFQLCGDVCTGTFSQRVIDGLDYTADELAVIQQRMLEQCRDELLQVYLSQYRGSAEGSAGAGRRDGEWTDTFTLQLRKVLSTGLAKEVLFTLGAEYERMVHYYDLQYKEAGAEGAKVEEVPLPALVWRRTHFFATSILPHRWQVRRMKMKYLTTVRSNSFKDSAVMVDLAWYISVEELEKTARWVAFSVLYDPSITSAEARRRRDGLLAFSAVLKRYGQAYKGANKATMDELMNSLRTYQQKKEQDRYS